MKPFRIRLRDKCGFRNITGNPVVILDSRGVIFYDTRQSETPVWEFNLPAGEYFIERGKISEMPSPVDYPLLPMPAPERNKRGNPELFKLEFGVNPMKASIDWVNKKILFDNELKRWPLPALMFILYHERAHKYYATEALCDRYASNEMIRAGYNPSQIGNSVLTLSEKQHARKEFLIDSLNNVNHYDYADAPEITDNKLLYAKKPILFHSKVAGDFFPLTDNQKMAQSGQFLGSVIDAQNDDTGAIWLKVSVMSPSWFKYDDQAVYMKDKDNGATLSAEAQREILKNILRTAPGGAPIVATAETVVDAGESVATIAGGLQTIIKHLPLILIGVAAVFVYSKVK